MDKEIIIDHFKQDSRRRSNLHCYDSYDLVTSLVLFVRTNMRKTNTSGYIKENLTTFVLLLCNKRSYDLKHVKFKSDELFTLVWRVMCMEPEKLEWGKNHEFRWCLETVQRNWTLATNFNFLIPISMQTDFDALN